jgi:hypothetical protein
MTRILKALCAMALLLGALAVPAGGDDSATVGSDTQSPTTMAVPRPSWYTPELNARVLANGKEGIEVPLDSHQLEINCLGYSPPGVSTTTGTVKANAVSAGGCMVSPSGCTMNFVFRDSSSWYIGTAGHCVPNGGDVVMQVGTRVDPTSGVAFATIAKVGRVVKKVNQGIGADFGLVKIDPGWVVMPGIAGAAGPTGVLCLDPVGQPVAHYGHGYVFAVGPGTVKFGEVIPDLSLVVKGAWATGYNWVGYGVPGDSGSGVMNDAGLVVGNLTHGLGVAGVPLVGTSFGMTIDGIFKFLGRGYALVTVDGRKVACPGDPIDLGTSVL